ncbi:hypothetical protein BC827DRAFT_1267790 [Russula dissimulans]|nr:hypothetical protein BC827DRAFT_1267790 [Russula dissimulans]
MAEPTASSSIPKIPKPKPKLKKHKLKPQPDKTGDTVSAAENPTHARDDGADAGAGASLDSTTTTTTTLALASASTAAAVPEGLIQADYDVDFGEFDHDALRADDGAELWLVRAPSAVKARNLQRLEISSRVGLVGDLHRKSIAYDVWALEPIGGGDHQGDDELGKGAGPPVVGVSAEELNGLSVMLPCKRKGGKLYLAQKPVARHIVIAERPAKPTKPDTTSNAAAYQNPKREAYPEGVLTHRFRPYGDHGDLPPKDHIDVEMAEVSPKEKKHKRKGGEIGSSKKKKTKVAGS